MDNKKFETLMYFLIKDVAKFGFNDFLEEIGLTEDDYELIKKHLESTYKIEMYL
jgi:5-bromo-4-chloroindolyl phosphate hydrolysis protein